MRTSPNAAGECKITFENPRGMDPKAARSGNGCRVDRQAGWPESTKIFKQLDIESGRYEVPVTIPAVRVADSEVAVTFVTIQKEHDAWVKRSSWKAKVRRIRASWTEDHAMLPAIPVGK